MDLKALKREAGRASTSKERMIELVKLDPSLSREIAKYRSLHPDIVQELCKSRDMPTRAALAKNSETPLAILEILVKDPQWMVVKAILGSKVMRKFSYSRMVFETVARHKRHTVRLTDAESVDCPLDLLEELSQDAEKEVRSCVARHSKATPEILSRLATDAELSVLIGVAGNPNTSNQTLDLLAQHPHAIIREHSIHTHMLFSPTRRDIPVARLEMLKDDPSPDVLSEVLENSNTPKEVVEHIFTHHPMVFDVDNGYDPNRPEYASMQCLGLQGALKHQPDLDTKWLHRLAQIHNDSVSKSVYAHPKVTPEILDVMAQVYLGYLERHPIPDKTLGQPAFGLQEQLIKRAKFFLTDLTHHSKISQATLQNIVAEMKKTTLIQHSINVLCNSPHEEIRQAVPDILEAIRANHMSRLDATQDVSEVFWELGQLTEFAALAVESQKRILETISAIPRETLHPNVIHRFKQSSHALIQAYFAGM